MSKAVAADVDEPDQLGGPTKLRFPSKWTLSTSWRRAQEDDAAVNPVTPAEYMIQLGGGDLHRTTFVVESGELLADCDCHGWQYNQWCAHVARLWWQWSRGRLVVTDLDSDRSLTMPPAWLSVGGDRPG